MVIWYLRLGHPSGRKSTKKFKTREKSMMKARDAYYGSVHHFDTESWIVGMSRSKKRLKEMVG